MKTYVVWATVGVVERRTIENMNNVMPAQYDGDVFDWVAEQLGIHRSDDFKVLSLDEFCEAVNDQWYDDMTSSWIGYFQREEK